MASAGFPDEPHIARIAEALWARAPSGSAALLIGAGFSRNAVPTRKSAVAMPGWNDIYRTMVDQLYPVTSVSPAPCPTSPPGAQGAASWASHRDWLLQQTGSTSAYLRIGEEFEAQFGRDALDKLILRHVPDRQFAPGTLHDVLVQLPWADIMTTNWDTLLERAAERAEERVYDVVRTVEEIPEARAPRIIKLHGSFPAYRPFVFTEEDFRTYPFRAAAFVNLAQQLAMENTLVLLGFSGDDPNFLFWSGWVRDRLGPKAPLIYLVGVLGLTPPKRKMLESRRIQPIDLAQLPEYQSWPASRRVEFANQWFLERLRAAEPYPAQRWPRLAAAFDPPLALVTAPVDPFAPLPEPDLQGDPPRVQKLRALVAYWRQTRSVYPGWIIAPLDTSELVWMRINRHFSDIHFGLAELPEDERLDALFELNWQLEAALIPLVLTVDDQIIALLDAMVARYDQMPSDRAQRFRALALALVRHAREENDRLLFDRWVGWLEPRLADDIEARDRLTYERCLALRADLSIDALEAMVKGWDIQGDTYWLVRKAGLLADLGHDKEASDLSSEALNAIRAQTLRGERDIAAWSRESFAMLFRMSAMHGEIGRWTQNRPTRDRFELRQDQLTARGCPGRSDFFDLVDQLARTPPQLRQMVESRQQFDLGSVNRTHHLSRLDPREQRLLAYQALRFQEEVGLPVRIGHAGVAFQILSEAAVWLIDIAPMRAIDAFLRAAPDASKKDFDLVLARSSVARMTREEAERIFERATGLIAEARTRIEADPAHKTFWRDRLKSIVEIASRVVLRLPERAAELLDIGLALQRHEQVARIINLGDELRRLVARALEAADPNDADAMLLTLFSQPIPPRADDGPLSATDLAGGLSRDLRVCERDSGWASIVTDTIAALGDPQTRSPASTRLEWLCHAKLLSDDDLRQFADMLWLPEFLEHGLPGKTVFYPTAFLQLPKPDQVDPWPAISSLLFDGTPLTDAIVADGALAFAHGNEAVALNEVQLRDEISRLHAFIANHEPEPDLPDFFGDERLTVIEYCARMAAALAWRALAFPGASEPIRALAALDRYPLRVEPAAPALVRLGVMKHDDAIRRLRALLAGEEVIDALLLGAGLDELLRDGDRDEVYEAAMWRELAQSVAARRPESLARVLRFIAHVMRTEPARIPLAIDETLSFGLALILSETLTTEASEQLGYDPFLVRYFGAVLVTAMDRLDRGDPALREAWTKAIDDDPLPDTRRARSLA